MTDIKALIIEDDANSARVLSHLLSKASIVDVEITDSERLDAHIDTNPDIVFVDLEMPYMTGYEVLEALLGSPHYQTIPIIASSVHLDSVNQVRDAGFHSFIGKPLEKDKFPHQLQRILDGENVWEAT